VETLGNDEILMRSCTAVVFCGGRATRLQSYLSGRAKALVTLDRKPYLHGLLNQLHDAGLKEVILCVSPFTTDIIEDVRGGRRLGLEVRYSLDTGLHENASALWYCHTHIRTPLALCINGDTIVDVDFGQLLRAHLRSGATCTLVASDRTDQPHPGAIEVGTGNRVIDLHEWEQDRGIAVRPYRSSRFYTNSGVYVFDMTVLGSRWAAEDRAGKIEQGLLRSLAKSRSLFAYRNGSKYLLDLGTPHRLSTARSQLSSISQFFTV
jgi:NDP-sugar pyrophosphorylase family protein